VSNNITRFREQRSAGVLLVVEISVARLFQAVASNTEHLLAKLQWCYWLTADLGVLWWQDVAAQ